MANEGFIYIPTICQKQEEKCEKMVSSYFIYQLK
jgi:hypothetical protein